MGFISRIGSVKKIIFFFFFLVYIKMNEIVDLTYNKKKQRFETK